MVKDAISFTQPNVDLPENTRKWCLRIADLRNFFKILPLSGLTYGSNCFSSLYLSLYLPSALLMLELKYYLISFRDIISATVLILIIYRGWNVLLYDLFLIISLSCSFCTLVKINKLVRSIMHMSVNFVVDERLSERESLVWNLTAWTYSIIK